MTTVWLLAGEASGDVIGARLMRAMTALRPGLRYAGIGGPRMAEAGLASLFPMRDLSVMGLAEILPSLRLLARRLAEAERQIRDTRPDLIVTIDSPGFAFRLLRRIASTGIPRVHVVAPQLWAWRPDRARELPGLWEKLLCLLPFEPAFFARYGIAAEFVGHPVLESGADQGEGARFRAMHGLAPEVPVLILMPGSRRTEVPRLLPVFRYTVARLLRTMPDLAPVLPVSPAVADLVARQVRDWRRAPLIVSDSSVKHDAYAASGAALTKSGTSTLELALAGVPMAVTYRVNPITAALARRMITVPHVAMVNLLAGREVVPELLQRDCNPARLARVAETLFEGGETAAAQRAAYPALLDTLRPPGGGSPSHAAAEAALRLLA